MTGASDQPRTTGGQKLGGLTRKGGQNTSTQVLERPGAPRMTQGEANRAMWAELDRRQQEITRLRDLLRRWHAAGSLSGGQLADLIRETEGVLG